VLILKNPHSVLAALESRPEDVTRIVMPGGGKGKSDLGEGWERVARLARENKIPIDASSGPKAGAPRTGGDGRVGVAEAHVNDRQPVSAEELFAGAKERAGGHGLWLALDSLQDPHNVGAIFRTAAFFGVQGIILTVERSAPLTAAVYDVAAGGLEHVPFTLQTNIQRAFEIAKEQGLWILGTSEHANDDFLSVARDRPWLLVLGNEERGMRRLTEESCDVLCRISPQGKTTSLNVSVAAGVFISRLTSPA
jgi:23S rRNA (guanosine2251-2'-O)-methyltransferase